MLYDLNKKKSNVTDELKTVVSKKLSNVILKIYICIRLILIRDLTVKLGI